MSQNKPTPRDFLAEWTPRPLLLEDWTDKHKGFVLIWMVLGCLAFVFLLWLFAFGFALIWSSVCLLGSVLIYRRLRPYLSREAFPEGVRQLAEKMPHYLRAFNEMIGKQQDNEANSAAFLAVFLVTVNWMLFLPVILLLVANLHTITDLRYVRLGMVVYSLWHLLILVLMFSIADEGHPGSALFLSVCHFFSMAATFAAFFVKQKDDSDTYTIMILQQHRDNKPIKLRFFLKTTFLMFIDFAAFYYALSRWNTESFSTLRPLTVIDSIYFSFVTGFTIGYGDITPRADVVKLVCIGQMVTGFFLFAIVLATVVSLWQRYNLSEPEKPAPADQNIKSPPQVENGRTESEAASPVLDQNEERL